MRFAYSTLVLCLGTALKCCMASTVSFEDLKTPEICAKQIETFDHVLIKYAVKETHTGEDVYTSPEDESYHMVIGTHKVVEGLNQGLVGACEGGVRRITVPPSLGYEGFTREPPMTNIGHLSPSSSLDFYITVENVTKPEDYEIFTAIKNKNMSKVLDMIESKRGINAVDEWGASPLMVAVSSGLEVVVATLLNSWRPRVNVNARKPSGYSALIYAATKPNPSFLRALLQRGADPNQIITSGPSTGWAPLHFAVSFGHVKNAQALLDFGANPTLIAKDGTRAIDLVRGVEDATTRSAFTKLLVEAADRWRAAHTVHGDL